MIVWVVGAGGLLGSGVVRCARDQGHVVLTSSGVPWSDPEGTVDAIRSDAQALRRAIAGARDEKPGWGIVWAAGHATTASPDTAIEQELRTFQMALNAIGEELATVPNGTFALASSAGGVYAGSQHPPFSSNSIPMPLGAYGKLKLAQEQAARDSLSGSIRVLIARIANVYGPGQDLGKLQGLISRLALTSVTKEPLTMFVPLDTMRDYITADDAAQRLLHWLTVGHPRISIRVIASGQATSLGYLINVMKDITRVATPIAYGIHESAAYQSADLRLLPDSDEVIDDLPLTPLPVGVKAVYQDVLWHAMYEGSKSPSPATQATSSG